MTALPETSGPALHRLRERAFAALRGAVPAAVDLRHRIHADPRVSGHEEDTAALLADAMRTALGELTVQWVTQGWLARLGAPTGPSIALRAELDALAVHEENEVPWRSTHQGVAHLCGHDVHMAALYAAVRAIAEAGFPVPLVAVFQPREETLPSGAADIVSSGLLTAHDVGAFLGVHLQPQIRRGQFSAAAGTVNASADEFTVVIRGVPSHGAYPHLSRDPIVATSAFIQSLQHLVSRRTDPMRPAVVSIGSLHGGSSFNTIPGEVQIRGTLRAYSEEHRRELHEAVENVARGIAAAHGCEADTVVAVGEPPMTNDTTLAELVTMALAADGLTPAAPPLRSCGADDFAFYGTVVPALMIFAGVGPGDGTQPGLHHPRFLPPDHMIETVARIMISSYFAVAEPMLGDAGHMIAALGG